MRTTTRIQQPDSGQIPIVFDASNGGGVARLPHITQIASESSKDLVSLPQSCVNLFKLILIDSARLIPLTLFSPLFQAPNKSAKLYQATLFSRLFQPTLSCVEIDLVVVWRHKHGPAHRHKMSSVAFMWPTTSLPKIISSLAWLKAIEGLKRSRCKLVYSTLLNLWNATFDAEQLRRQLQSNLVTFLDFPLKLKDLLEYF